jgi:hypothetical protein
VLRQLNHTPKLLSTYEGSVQTLPHGNVFVGWGAQPYFTEYNTRGNVVFEARMVGNNASYRAYRFRWSGTPESKPSVAGVTKGSRTKVSASWNGATAVARWRVLGGSSGSSLHTVTTVAKNGFETAVGIAARRYIQVQALSASGTVLGTSPVAAASG